MINFEINKPWEQLKHLDFNCFIANNLKCTIDFLKCTYFYGNILILIRFFYLKGSFVQLVQLCTFLLNRGHIFLYHTYMVKHRRQYSISNRIQCYYLLTPKYVLRVQFRVHNLDFETEHTHTMRQRNTHIMEHTYTMGQVMENSSFGIIIIRNRFEIEVMNTKLNSQNIFGS